MTIHGNNVRPLPISGVTLQNLNNLDTTLASKKL
jgi:hypothetical protein